MINQTQKGARNVAKGKMCLSAVLVVSIDNMSIRCYVCSRCLTTARTNMNARSLGLCMFHL